MNDDHLSQDAPFPAVPERKDGDRAGRPIPPAPAESAGDAFERGILAFVTERLDQGVEETELVGEVREFGLNRRGKLQFHAPGVGLPLSKENYESDVLNLVANLVAAGKSPQEIVEALAGTRI